jgi:predicted nucleic acid-binding protein
MIVLDTNIVIAYLQDEQKVVKWIQERRRHGILFCISTITVVELLSFPKISDDEIKRIIFWLDVVMVVDVDSTIVMEAAEIRREFKLTTTDSIIAATAFLASEQLATRDIAFKNVKKIRVIVL